MKKSRSRRKTTKQIDSPVIGGVLIGDSLRPRPTPAKPLGIEFINRANPQQTKQHTKKFVKGFVKK